MSKWIIDSDHSVAAFAIRHMAVAYVHGQLNKVAGTVLFNPADMNSLKVELEIDLSSIITGIQKRDDHLKSQDFFDEETFPKITFKSTKTEKIGSESCKVYGDLNIHGVTVEISIDIDISGPVKSPFDDDTTIGLTGKTTLNREDFGLTWNVPMDNGGLMVGKEVEVSINIEADLKTE